MVSQSKNGKLYIFPKYGFSIKKWKTIYFPKIWFLNQKMENYKFSIIWFFPKYGFSIKKWKTIYFPLYGFSQNMVSQSKNGKLYIFHYMVFPKYGFLNHMMVSQSYNGFSIIIWFSPLYGFSVIIWIPKIWFLNQKRVTIPWFSIILWYSSRGFHHFYKNIMIYMFFQTYESLERLNYW